MQTIWQSLAWKDWHEHKWKLLSLTLVLCGVSALLLANGQLDRPDVFEALYAMTACCAIPLAIFVAASEAAGEKSRGTARFLESQPLAMWKVAAFKLAAGVMTIVVPIVLAFVFDYLWIACVRLLGGTAIDPSTRERIIFKTPFDFDNWFVESGLMIVLIAGSIYLWTAAFGVGRSDEISAAARAALAIALWWAIVFGAYVKFFGPWLQFDGYWLKSMVQAISPGGVGMMSERRFAGSHPEPLQLLAEQNGIIFAGLIGHLCLALLFIRRFGRTLSDSSVASRPTAIRKAKIDWLGPPRQSALAAIAWKQMRESGSIALAGMACILLITTVMTYAMWERIGWQKFIEMYAGATISMGMFITLVAGIGVMLYDTSPQLNTFWRSRPINPDLWFWTKFVTGLAVLAVTLYLPAVIGLLASQEKSWCDLLSSETLVLPAITLGVYISAVTMTALVRQAIYAAILSIAAMYSGPLVSEIGRTIATRIWGKEPAPLFESENGPMMVAAMCLMIFGTLIVGWLAVRNDWGRKSRY